MSKPSLYPTDEGCYVCGNPVTVCHHIFPGHGRRSISDREGCTIRLCPNHHNMSIHGIHFDRELDERVRKDCQRRWEEREGKGHEDFIKLFGRNYLD